MHGNRRRYAAKITLSLSGALLMAALLAPGPAARAQDPAPELEAPAQTPEGEMEGTGDADAERRQRRRPRLRFGPQVGVFLPTSGKTRDRFGDSWTSFGVGLGNIRAVGIRGRLSLELDVLSRRRGDNRALLIPIGVGYRRALARGATRPYVGASLNLILADLRSPADGVSSGMRTGWGGSAFAGMTVKQDAFLEARYHGISRIRGFDLSGLSLTAGYRF